MHRNEIPAPAGSSPSPHGPVTVVFCKPAIVLSAAFVLALAAPAQQGHAQEIPGILNDEVDSPGPSIDIERPGLRDEIGRPGKRVDIDGSDSFNATGLTLLSPQTLARFPQPPLHRGPLPKFANIIRHFPKPGNQGRQGSCGGWAVAYARTYYRFWWLKKQGRQPTAANIVSPAYIYDISRRGWCNTGTTFSENLRVLQRGAASWGQYPYNPYHCRRPSSGMRQSVRGKFQNTRYWYIEPRNINQVKAQLAKGHPVLFGAYTDSAFLRLGKYRPHRGKSRWKNYLWTSGYPTAHEKRSGHAMVLYGYWDGCRCFGIINSWGRRWANGGYAFISYDTFRKRVHSAWTMRPEGIGVNQRIR